MLREHLQAGGPHHTCTALILLAIAALGVAEEPAVERSIEERIVESDAVLAGEPGAHALELLAAAEADPSSPAAELALRLLAELWDELPAQAPLLPRLLALHKGAGSHAAEIARHLATQVLLAQRFDDGARELTATHGGIRAWAVIAPFGDVTTGDFDRPFPPEQNDDPTLRHASKGEERSWKAVPVRDDRQPALRLVEGESSGFCYARAVFSVAEDVDGFLAIEAPRPFKLWLDGELVCSADSFRATVRSESYPGVTVPAGVHVLLLKAPSSGEIAVRLLDGAEQTVPVTGGDPLAAGAPGAARASGREPAKLAVAHYRRLHEAGADGSAWAGVAYAYLSVHLGDPDTALDVLEHVVPALGSPPCATLHLAGALLGTELRPEAEAQNQARALLESLPVLAPQSVMGEISLARFELSRDRHVEAKAFLDAALERVGDSRAVRRALADLYARKDWNDEAREVLQELHRADRDDLQVMNDLAGLEEERGNFAGQHELLEIMLAKHPGDTSLVDWKVRELERHSDLAGAETRLRAELARAPGRRERREALLSFFQRHDQHDAALRLLDELLVDYPDDDRLRTRRGELLVILGRRSDAVAAFRAVLEHDPGRHELREYLEHLTKTETDLADQYLVWLEDVEDIPSAADYPEAPACMVLDEAVLRIYPDGSSLTDVYACHKALTREGIATVATVNYGGELITARTHLPGGQVLEPIRVGGGSFEMPGVEVGAIVETRYLRRADDDDGRFPDYTWYFQDTRYTEPFHLSRLVAIVPKEMRNLLIRERNFTGTHEVQDQGDVIVHTWEVKRSPRLIPESRMPPPEEVLPTVHIETPASWEETFARGRDFFRAMRGSPQIDRQAKELIAGVPGASARDQARVLYEFVNRKVTHDSGENPTVTLLSGQGNRQMLFAALAHSAGLEVQGVEVGPHPQGAVRPDYRFPSDAFNRTPLLALPMGEELLYLDFTSRFLPFGELAEGNGGALAILHGSAGSQLTLLPRPEFEFTGGVHDADLFFEADGSTRISGTYRWPGAQGAATKEIFQSWEPQVRRQRLGGFLGTSYPQLNLTEFDMPGIDDPTAPLVVSFSGTSKRMLVSEAGSHAVVTGFSQINLATLLLESERKFDYLGDAEIALHSVARIHLGEGVTCAGIPPTINLLSPLGHLRQTFTRTGARAIVVERTLRLWGGRITPPEYGSWVEFCRSGDRSVQERVKVELAK